MLLLRKIEEPPVTEPVAHQSVLLRETLELLAPQRGDVAVDATVGAGGHTELLLEAVGAEGRVVGIDRDPGALEVAGRRLHRFGEAFVALRGNHVELGRLLDEAGIEAVDRILFDLGLSSLQLDDPSRGFSFQVDGPLDMRMDPSAGRTADNARPALSVGCWRSLVVYRPPRASRLRSCPCQARWRQRRYPA